MLLLIFLHVLALANNFSHSSPSSCTCSPFSGNPVSCCNHNDQCSHLSSSVICKHDTPICCNSDFDSHCCPPSSACSQGCRNSLLGSCTCIPLRPSNYNESNALFSLAFVAAAQCTPTGGLNNSWSCTACSKTVPLCNVIVVQEAEHLALVGYSKNRNAVVVALRGSLSFNDVIDDLKAAIMVPLPRAIEQGCTHGCQVADGFLEAVVSLQQGIEDAVTTVLALHPGCESVVVTGHSLGAAMLALLLSNNTAAPSISFNHLVQRPIYTFGQPRVGNSAYAQWISSKIFKKGD